MEVLLASGKGMVCPMFLTEQVEANEYGMKHDGMAPVCWYAKLKDHEEFMSSELYKSGCGEQFAEYAHQAVLGTFNKKLLKKYGKCHLESKLLAPIRLSDFEIFSTPGWWRY